MRLGILTGGGDVPGLNPCIKAVVDGAHARGWEVFGFRRGWAGPLNIDSFDPDGNAKWVEKLTPASVRTIDRAGGTTLHTSRTNPGRVAPDAVPHHMEGRFTPDPKTGKVDCTAHVVEALSWLGIDCLIPIGGDDTLSYAAHLATQGVRVVAIPKTMDNDVFGTDYCIGFSTAVTRSVEFIHALRTPAGSHERIAVIELFGRHSGETALIAGYLSDADRTLISEVPVDIDRLATLVRQDRIDNPSHYALIVVSEGATLQDGDRVERGEADAYGHLKLGGIGQIVGAELKARTGVEIINQSLGYLMRSGAPDSLDRMVAVTFGNLALQEIADGAHDIMLALRGGRYATVPLATCIAGEKRVDVANLYDVAAYRPNPHHVVGAPMFLY
ncbi:MAG: ATP-dependent 6-phosphofructokinase [Proteobacteria bacterium]|nr:ATP-dependent 6-phosphofructokinase [Pseudomonadota bacterium]MDA1059359.1 ATP-dependent 6-phosphofructokinase [Pseudomonadota bacterium]